MTPERFLDDEEADLDPAEVGRSGCLMPTGDAEVQEGGNDGED